MLAQVEQTTQVEDTIAFSEVLDDVVALGRAAGRALGSLPCRPAHRRRTRRSDLGVRVPRMRTRSAYDIVASSATAGAGNENCEQKSVFLARVARRGKKQLWKNSRQVRDLPAECRSLCRGPRRTLLRDPRHFEKKKDALVKDFFAAMWLMHALWAYACAVGGDASTSFAP